MSYDPPPQASNVGPPVRPRRDTKAVLSFALGLVGLLLTIACGFGVVLGVVALILGILSRNEPNSRWMAITGIVTGSISIALVVLLSILLATGVFTVPEGA